MSDILLVLMAAALVAGFLGLFYVTARAGIRNFPYDRPTTDPIQPSAFDDAHAPICSTIEDGRRYYHQ